MVFFKDGVSDFNTFWQQENAWQGEKEMFL